MITKILDKKYKTEQIHYSMYSEEGAPHSYFRDIENIALFIACALEKSYTTISVSQHKEKFGTVRVYTTLASYEKVDASYNNYLSSFYKKKEACESTNMVFTQTLISYEQFLSKCIYDDCRHYRRVYLDMVALCPHYEKSIISNADYDELLIDESDLEDIQTEYLHKTNLSLSMEKYINIIKTVK